MKTSKQLHNMAMENFDSADLAWRFDPLMSKEQKEWHYKRACKLERRAAQTLQNKYLFPNIILFRSAASIAYQAGLFDLAFMIAYQAYWRYFESCDSKIEGIMNELEQLMMTGMNPEVSQEFIKKVQKENKVKNETSINR